MMFKKPTQKASLDTLADRLWQLCLGRHATEIFAAGVTLLINAAAAMPQTMRSEAAYRLRLIADRIQTGEAFEAEAQQGAPT